MKRIKRLSAVLSVVLCISILFSGNVFAAQDDKDESMDYKKYTYIESTRYFSPNNKNIIREISPRGPAYNVGEIRIDDVLNDESAIVNGCTKSAIGSAFLNLSIVLFTKVPVIGTFVSTGSDIISCLSPLYSKINDANYSRNMKVVTQYTYRNFNHIIYAYNDNYTWQEVGLSSSKYYYKLLDLTWYSNKGEFDGCKQFFNESAGYGPEYVAQAANWKNYSALSNYGYEAYKTNRKFNEHC